MKIIVAGSTTFGLEELFRRKMKRFLKNVKNPHLLYGPMALNVVKHKDGAFRSTNINMMIERLSLKKMIRRSKYATDEGHESNRFPWNETMCEDADALILFIEKKSWHKQEDRIGDLWHRARKHNLKIRIVRFGEPT